MNAFPEWGDAVEEKCQKIKLVFPLSMVRKPE